MKRLFATLDLVLAATGCANITKGVRVATHTTLRTADAAPDPALLAKHCSFGEPTKLPTLEHGPTQVVTRPALEPAVSQQVGSLFSKIAAATPAPRRRARKLAIVGRG